MTRTTCREVALAIALRNVTDVGMADHHAHHLVSCSKCVAFERQLAFVTEAVRCVCASFEQELPEDFEERVFRRLSV